VAATRRRGPDVGRLLTVLAAAAAAAGCFSGVVPERDASVAVFVLDSPMDRDFVRGRAALGAPSRVSHGSLVGRVLWANGARHFEARVVEKPGGGISRPLYLGALGGVLSHLRRAPRTRVVVNVSLASPARDEEEARLIRQIAAAGGLVVAAAGNDGTDAPMYPAAYPDVIAVASATLGGKAATSSFGRHVDVAASGDVTFIDDEFLPYQWLRRRTEAEGTSFAAPRIVASVAWVLERRPELTARQAFDVVAARARPIRDDRFRRGLLGAGLVEPARVRAASPARRFLHVILPVITWVAMGAATVWLCLRHGLPGVFVSLIMWLVLLPATILLLLEFRGYLYVVGAGRARHGLVATAIVLAGAAASWIVQSRSAAKTALAALPPFGLFVAWCALEVADPVRPMVGAAAAAGLALVGSGAMALRARRALRLVGELPGSADPGAVAARLIRIYRRSLDERIRAAVIGALGTVPDPAAVEFLLSVEGHGDAAVQSLVAIAGERPDLLVPWQERSPDLAAAAVQRLTSVLETIGIGTPDDPDDTATKGDRQDGGFGPV